MTRHPGPLPDPDREETRTAILVVGGGNGGISLAARLVRHGHDDVLVVDPAAFHTYRPLLNYVGAGLVPLTSARRPQAEVIPRGCAGSRRRSSDSTPRTRWRAPPPAA